MKDNEFEKVLESLQPVKKKKTRPTPKGHPRKDNRGVFAPYYGTKFFCSQTGAIFILMERDPKLGLNVLRIHRGSLKRLEKVNKGRIERGLVPNYVGDIYLSDAETVLLLRDYTLPYLGIDLRLFSKENLRIAMEEQHKAILILKEEATLRSKIRDHMYFLTYRRNVPERITPLRLPAGEFMPSEDALKKVYKDMNKAESVLFTTEETTKDIENNKKLRMKHQTRKELTPMTGEEYASGEHL